MSSSHSAADAHSIGKVARTINWAQEVQNAADRGRESNGWLSSRWKLTYKAGWERILNACAFSSKYYDQFEVVVDNQIVPVHTEEEILALEEAGSLIFRGMSTIVKVPVMITLYNQMDAVDVSVAMATDEFSKADYEMFNKSMGQYMDSVEIAMYR